MKDCSMIFFCHEWCGSTKTDICGVRIPHAVCMPNKNVLNKSFWEFQVHSKNLRRIVLGGFNHLLTHITNTSTPKPPHGASVAIKVSGICANVASKDAADLPRCWLQDTVDVSADFILINLQEIDMTRANQMHVLVGTASKSDPWRHSRANCSRLPSWRKSLIFVWYYLQF